MAAGVREIARATGYSVATVSRALNDDERVSAKAREIVLKAAQALEYSPNPAARALSTRRTRTIGAAIPGIENSIFARFIASLESRLAGSGYALVLATTGNSESLENRRARDLVRLGAEGLVVSGLEHAPDLLSLAAARRVPVVCTSIFDAGAELPTIGYDNRQLAVQAVEYLVGLGHRRVAVVHGPVAENDRTRLRIEGAASVLGADAEFCETELSVIGGVSAAQSLLQPQRKFSAILCLSDVLAQGVWFEAMRRSIRIPQETSLMGFDDLEWAAHAHPALTTIHLPVVEMGHLVAEGLIDNLENGGRIQSRLLAGRIVERDSTAAA